MYQIKQILNNSKLNNIPLTVSNELDKLKLENKIKKGDTVAITAGSRGIRNIDTILKSVVDKIKNLGGLPFIFPAMGSHGGGTAEGQKKILTNYGITEKNMGCEIKSTMNVIQIGKTKSGVPVFVDKFAYKADHIVIVNRIKIHTKYSGKVESGLQKMALIGLGKYEGAKIYHEFADNTTWDNAVNEIFEFIVRKLSKKIIFGLAILQNGYEDIAKIVALKLKDFRKQEPALLKESYKMMAKLPFSDVNLLIIDEMGKNISGTGMDTNIIGRKKTSKIIINRIFIRDLTVETHENAHGVGFADFTTKKLVEKIDYKTMYINSQTANRTNPCKIPMTLDNDYEALKIACKMAGFNDPKDYKIIWIKNTSVLNKIWVSEAYLKEVKTRKDLTIVNESEPYKFHFNRIGSIKK